MMSPPFAFAIQPASIINKKWGLLLALWLTCLLAQAATVQAVVGRVQVERAGRADTAAQQQVLRAGDVIVTQAGGSLVLKLDDGALLLVREQARVRLETLAAQASGDQPAQVFRVTVGALRYVTGLIGKERPEAIRFITPTATVGIRGTDLDVVVRALSEADLLPGTYVKVNTGAVQLSSGTDNLDILASQAAFAGEPVVTRGGRRQATTRRIEGSARVFQRSALDDLLPR
jgi:OmpA-OmpF porin, OOP family